MSIDLEPFPNLLKYDWNQEELIAWFHRLFFKTGLPGGILFTELDFNGSNITFIQTRNHDDLQNRFDINGNPIVSATTKALHFTAGQFEEALLAALTSLDFQASLAEAEEEDDQMTIAQLLTGPQTVSDGSTATARGGKGGETITQNLHGRYFEQSARRNIFWAANQAATTWSAALATTHTGFVLSNPAGSGVNLSVLHVGFVLTVAPAAIASVGLFSGFSTTGITVHTTPLSVFSSFIGSSGGGQGLVDAAATLVGTPAWTQHMMGGFTAAALPSTTPILNDVNGIYVIPPGGYVGIAALTAVVGMGSMAWEETPV